MMFFSLLHIESLKLKRSLVILICLLCPFVVALLMALIQYKSKSRITWEMFWMNISMTWFSFMFPLFIAVAAGLINTNEHKNQTWRLMLCLPFKAWQFYLAKFSILVGLCIFTNLVLIVFAMLAIFALSKFGMNIDGAFQVGHLMTDWTLIPRLILASLPIIAMQFALSWKVKNIAVPITFSFLMTVGLTQFASSKDWVFYPWAYPLLLANGNKAETVVTALQLGTIVGASILICTCYWLTRQRAEYA
jgi:hypothetical protein